jgi:hypothetical protein
MRAGRERVALVKAAAKQILRTSGLGDGKIVTEAYPGQNLRFELYSRAASIFKTGKRKFDRTLLSDS